MAFFCYHGYSHARGDQGGQVRTESPQLAAEEPSADSKKELLHWACVSPPLPSNGGKAGPVCIGASGPKAQV